MWICFDGIRRRGAFVNTDLSVQSVLLSPDGETGILTADGAMHRITFGPNGDVDIDADPGADRVTGEFFQALAESGGSGGGGGGGGGCACACAGCACACACAGGGR